MHVDGEERRMSRVAPPPNSRATVRRTPAKPPRPLDLRPSRWQLMRRRQRWLLRPAAWTLAGVVAVMAVVGLVRTVQPSAAIATLRDRVGKSLNLVVRDVVVEGRDKTPERLLRTALGVSVGDRMLDISIEGARTRIERLTWVQHATVERRLPGTVVVRLQERRPFAVWQTGSRFVLIDRAGQVVAEQDPVKDAAAFSTLPLVVGPGASDAAAALLDQLAAQPELRGRVVAAVRVGERRWNLRLNNGADVLLPEGAEAAAMVKLMELHATQALLDRPLKTLDLRAPDRMVVRPQTEPREAPTPTPGPRRPT